MSTCRFDGAVTAAFVNSWRRSGTLTHPRRHRGGWEYPGFQTIGVLVSNQAYAAGLHAFMDARGHSVGITQLGTPLEYDFARIIEKYGIPLSAVRVIPLQSNPNVASALKGGQIDIGVQTVAEHLSAGRARRAPSCSAGPSTSFGEVQLVSTVTFTSGEGRIADAHPDMMQHLARRFPQGQRRSGTRPSSTRMASARISRAPPR